VSRAHSAVTFGIPSHAARDGDRGGEKNAYRGGTLKNITVPQNLSVAQGGVYNTFDSGILEMPQGGIQ